MGVENFPTLRARICFLFPLHNWLNLPISFPPTRASLSSTEPQRASHPPDKLGGILEWDGGEMEENGVRGIEIDGKKAGYFY